MHYFTVTGVHMNFNWSFFFDAGLVGISLLIATFLRAKIRFFQKFLIPNALTAGFLLLLYYNFIAPIMGMDQVNIAEMVYHLLSLSFIAMTLRQTGDRRKGRNLYAMSVGVFTQFGIQATIGMILTLLMITTIRPDLFPSFGFLLPLGFAQGPGQAFAIGSGWEAFGFKGAGSVGLTFAALGFLFACFGGVFLINYGIRKGWMTPSEAANFPTERSRTGLFNLKEEERPVGSRLTTESEAVDTMTLNIGLTFSVYLLTFLLLKLLTWLLSFTGNAGRDLAVNLWGLSFIFAALISLIVKRIASATRWSFIIDNGSLTRISGTAIDMMVAGAIGAISLVVVAAYWLPVLIVASCGALVTFFTVPWICSRIFTDHAFHRSLIIYGVSTGTLPTGLALLRVVDPEFKTPVAADYMFSTAITFALAIPFVLSINLPVYYKTTGNPLYLWLTFGVCGVYLLFSVISIALLTRKNGVTPRRHIWKKDHHT